MLIFLDTEFTDLLDCDLISIGMVSLDGEHSLYLERSDYRADWCSAFVHAAVLPQLSHVAAVDRAELADRLAAWFASLPPDVVVTCDNSTDWELLLDAMGDHRPDNLTGCYDLRQTMGIAGFNAAAARYHEHASWHHALHDAQAHRHGWMAVQDHIKEPSYAHFHDHPTA
jgi:hypothetical protein